MQKIASAVIRAEHPIAYHADGEPSLGSSALTVTVEPASLAVRVP
jgi:diacylglycerol kinase family enzyme